MRLEVGTVLYYQVLDSVRRIRIDRVTDKRAFAGTICFDRDQPLAQMVRRGESARWGRTLYELETPELAAKYRRRKLEEELRTVRLEALTDKQLEAMLAIAKAEGRT